MAMDLKEIEKLIKEAMPDARIEIQDLAGDGNHYSATVTSSTFSGKSKIAPALTIPVIRPRRLRNHRVTVERVMTSWAANATPTIKPQ